MNNSNDNLGYIHSLETFGTVDGPGIRFVIFLQGCIMRCKYCHNPDTWYIPWNKSPVDTPTGVDSCDASNQGCGNGNYDYDIKRMSAQEIIDKVLRNKEFYATGGITVSGGEAMLQIDFVTELFTLAKENGIHTCLDTSGICYKPEDSDFMTKCDKLMAVTDLVMLDIKHIDAASHRSLTLHDNGNILAFLDYLEANEKCVWIRHVLVPGITNSEEQLVALGKHLSKYKCIDKIEVLPYHTLGVVKYENLGIDYPLEGVEQASKEDAAKALEIIKSQIN